MIDRIAGLGRRSNVQLTSLGLTPAARNIWCLRIGGEEREQLPGIAIVAGMDGTGLFGTEMSLRIADAVSQDETLLEKVSFYIIPLANPDVYANDPTKVRYEKHTNAQPIDDDRDGEVDEDPFEDLNKDKLITWMRIEDVSGSWRMHDDDPRVMVKADLSKGERGNYRMIIEGIDTDKDGQLNEDGVGGINLNRCLPFNYPAFAEGAGPYPAASIESRAILDMLYEQWNVHTILSFSELNNLSHMWEPQAPSRDSRMIKHVLPADGDAFHWVASNYQDKVPGKAAPMVRPKGGDLLSWGYYHYGRYSFSTPAWWIPKVEPDSGQKIDLSNETIRFLTWAERNGQSDLWVDWQAYDHPDFPDQKVEIGGMVPYANVLPPYSMVDSIAESHIGFVRDLAYMLPRMEFRNLKVEKIDGDLCRITVDLYNAGTLPTHSALGQRSNWVRKPMIELILNPDEEQVVLSGRPVQILGPVAGDQSMQLSWLVYGEGSLVLKAGSPICGFAQQVIELP
ncbi:MAG: M14 family metallopeptidase [Bacteroidota bacterium]